MEVLEKIVIIEDNCVYQELIKGHFTDKNYQVLSFGSGEEFLSENINPDLIILDNQLAGKLSGLEVLVRLHQDGGIVPIIFLCAQEDQNIAVQSLKMGAFDYVVKDENMFNQINYAISRYLEHTDAQKK